jgi:hypothetical protein
MEEAPRKRGRPPGSKNKKAEQEEAPLEPTEAVGQTEPEEPTEAVEPTEPVEPTEAVVEPPTAPAEPVKMKAPRVKKPAPRPNAPRPAAQRPTTPHPTAADIAREMVNAMDDRHHDRMLARQAMYSSWL